MEQGTRLVRRDNDLDLEAYQFNGVIQIFPGHFHPYYTLGFIEDGLQHTVCRDTERLVERGDLLLFAPGEVHACRPVDGRPLDYRGLNVPEGAMERCVEEITGAPSLPRFREPVVKGSELTVPLRGIHRMVMEGESPFRKEEAFLLFVAQLLETQVRPAPAEESAPSETVADLCAWMDAHCGEKVALEDLSARSGWSKYRLIRAFTREKGITPYSYLTAARVSAAKALLEKGASPLDAALETGFADQSHFTNQFKRLIGLTPGQYAVLFREGGERRG